MDQLNSETRRPINQCCRSLKKNPFTTSGPNQSNQHMWYSGNDFDNCEFLLDLTIHVHAQDTLEGRIAIVGYAAPIYEQRSEVCQTERSVKAAGPS
jgi:hypothetical protein